MYGVNGERLGTYYEKLWVRKFVFITKSWELSLCQILATEFNISIWEIRLKTETRNMEMKYCASPWAVDVKMFK